MAIDLAALESAIRNAVPVAHLDIEDMSSGCGESYAITLVSEVRGRFSRCASGLGNLTVCRLSRERQHFKGIDMVGAIVIIDIQCLI
jgi:hypothetical protein